MTNKSPDSIGAENGRSGDPQARVVRATLSVISLLILLLFGWASIPIGCDAGGSARSRIQTRLPEPKPAATTLTVESVIPAEFADLGIASSPQHDFFQVSGEESGKVQAIFRGQILALAGDDRLDRDACIAGLFEGFSAGEQQLLKRIEPPTKEARERIDSIDDPYLRDLRVFDVRSGSDVPHIVELLLRSGYVASPVYVYLPGPEWEFGPAETKHMVDGAPEPAQLPTAPWSIAVVDFFGSDPSHAIYGHGPFIVSTIQHLSAGTPHHR